MGNTLGRVEGGPQSRLERTKALLSRMYLRRDHDYLSANIPLGDVGKTFPDHMTVVLLSEAEDGPFKAMLYETSSITLCMRIATIERKLKPKLQTDWKDKDHEAYSALRLEVWMLSFHREDLKGTELLDGDPTREGQQRKQCDFIFRDNYPDGKGAPSRPRTASRANVEGEFDAMESQTGSS